MIDPEVTTIVGYTGSGKTSLLYALLKEVKFHIVMTTKPSGFTDGWIQVTSWQELARLVIKKYHHKRLKVCVRIIVGPRNTGLPVETMNGVADALFAIQQQALKKGTLRRIGLTVDEAHNFCPHNNVRGAGWLVSEGREWGIQTTFATQRPTNIPPVIRDNSKNWYVLALGGATAINAIRQAIPSLRNPQQFQFRFYRDGELVDEGSNLSPKPIISFP